MKRVLEANRRSTGSFTRLEQSWRLLQSRVRKFRGLDWRELLGKSDFFAIMFFRLRQQTVADALLVRLDQVDCAVMVETGYSRGVGPTTQHITVIARLAELVFRQSIE